MKFDLWFLLVLTWLLSTTNAHAQEIYSEQTQISIITCGPGDALYSLFGHSALRIFDPVNRIDEVYNYGTFDFEAPNFAVNFLRGKLTFWVAKTTYDRFLTEYYYTQRSVKEQVLDLSQDQTVKIIQFIQKNSLPENREYMYDFYFDNCTTRLRDILQNELGAEYPSQSLMNGTFRDLLHENLTYHPWTKFGMDIILGESSDENAEIAHQMFLPEYLYNYLNQTKIEEASIVKEEIRVLEFPLTQVKPSNVKSPSFVFWFLLAFETLILFMVFISGDNKKMKFIDNLWFSLLFLASLIFLFMWFFTDHVVCTNNWNLLWTCPWMIGIIGQKGNSKTHKILYWATIIVCLGSLIFWTWIPQYIPLSTIPIFLINILKGVRSLNLLREVEKYFWKGLTASFFSILLLGSLTAQEKMAGITVVGTPSKYTSDPMTPISDINANWIALVPFGYSSKDEPEVRYGHSRQWWGEKEEGIVESISLAKAADLKIMLKPQVWIPGGWVGEMDFKREDNWKKWEETYRSYILKFAKMASDNEIDLFCIGTEYRISTKKREAFWRNLIQEVREIYNGPLVYSANWDAYEEVPFGTNSTMSELVLTSP